MILVARRVALQSFKELDVLLVPPPRDGAKALLSAPRVVREQLQRGFGEESPQWDHKINKRYGDGTEDIRCTPKKGR